MSAGPAVGCRPPDAKAAWTPGWVLPDTGPGAPGVVPLSAGTVPLMGPPDEVVLAATEVVLAAAEVVLAAAEVALALAEVVLAGGEVVLTVVVWFMATVPAVLRDAGSPETGRLGSCVNWAVPTEDP